MKKQLLLIGLIILSVLFGWHTVSAKASESVKASYSLREIDKATMTDLQKIIKTDPTTKIDIEDARVTITHILPGSYHLSSQNKLASLISKRTALFNSTNMKTMDFETMVDQMDKSNGQDSLPNGTYLAFSKASKSQSYKGQKDGAKVSKGTHVHCNRFNGKMSDHKYWSKKHPRAYIDFIGSDCDWHAIYYNCSSFGKMTKCDGLNIKKNGAKDCSSFKYKVKGKALHRWPITAWYRK